VSGVTAGGPRHRSWSVGAGVGGCRVRSVRGQSVAGGPLPRTARRAGDSAEAEAIKADPASAARLSLGQIGAALKRARRRDVAAKAAAIQTALRSEQLMQPVVVTAAYAVSVRALVAVLGTLTSRSRPWKGRWRPFWPAPGR
jgi:hypothetical protein